MYDCLDTHGKDTTVDETFIHADKADLIKAIEEL